MKLRKPVVYLLALVLLSGTWVIAQESTASTSKHAKVLVVVREWEKLNVGSEHNKTEGQYAAALKKAGVNLHNFAACGITGKPRCLFFSGFDSYEDWFKAAHEMNTNKELAAALDPINKADSDLLLSYEIAVLSYVPELSYKDDHSVATSRFIEADAMRIKPGHMGDFFNLVKMVKEANDRAGVDSHWSAYQVYFGGDPSRVVFYTADKDAAEIDHNILNNDKMWKAMSELERQKFAELYKSIDSEEQELLAINPAMSYPPDAWVQANPDFWTPKTEEAPVKGKEKKKN